MTDFIITANRLHDGQVIFLTETSWSESIADAVTATDKDGTAALLARAEADAAIAVGPYEVPVTLSEAGPLPLKFKERLRTSGPSIAYLKTEAA